MKSRSALITSMSLSLTPEAAGGEREREREREREKGTVSIHFAGATRFAYQRLRTFFSSFVFINGTIPIRFKCTGRWVEGKGQLSLSLSLSLSLFLSSVLPRYGRKP